MWTLMWEASVLPLVQHGAQRYIAMHCIKDIQYFESFHNCINCVEELQCLE